MVEISYDSFGTTAAGVPVTRWYLEADDLSLTILDRGATVHALEAPDRHGVRADVVAGLGDIATYESVRRFFGGAVVGRFGNRLAGGSFELDGKRYQVPLNDGANALHGGPEGFDRRLWTVEPDGPDGLRCTLTSADGDQGFPGSLTVEVVYRLLPGVVRIEYRATTDAPTVLNLTQHAYFALDGYDAGTSGHVLQVDSGSYVRTADDLIPTGTIDPVEGTPLDLRTGRVVDDVIADLSAGIDHNFVLGPPLPADQLRRGGSLTAPKSGRRIEVFTSEPGLQIFSATPLDGTWIGKGGVPLTSGAGICLETQHFPDAPNRPDFPTTRLDPGHTYESTTEYHVTTHTPQSVPDRSCNP